MKIMIIGLLSLIFTPTTEAKTAYKMRPMYCYNWVHSSTPHATNNSISEFWLYGKNRLSTQQRVPPLQLILNQPSEVRLDIKYKKIKMIQQTLTLATLKIDSSTTAKWSLLIAQPKIEVIKSASGLPEAYYRSPTGELERFHCRDADPGLPGGGMSGGN